MPERPTVESTATSTELARVRWLSAQLDRRYIDPLLGFFLPGAGDLLASSMGAYVVYIAWKAGSSKLLLARMLANLAIDAGLGSLPLVGDIFDVFFKANQKNLQLLDRRSHAPSEHRWRDLAYLILAGLLFLGALVLPVLALIAVIGWLF